MNTTRKLSALQVAVALVTTHYGLGFLIGTGQDIVQYGSAGMLYAFSTAVGLLSLLPITKFYWKKRKPIWDIFAARHGQPSKKITAFLSSFWMIGVVSSQILGGSAALMLFGIPHWIATFLIAGLLLLLSYLNLGKLSKIFFYFLLVSSILIVFSMLKYGWSGIVWMPVTFVHSLAAFPIEKLLGIVITTVLITFIGMDFHQFIVAGKTSQVAQRGAVGGFIFLALLTFVLGTSITNFINFTHYNVNSGLSAAQIVPQMLTSLSGSYSNSFTQILLLLPIILVSAGSGSAVTKVIINAIHDLVPKTKNYNVLNVVILLIAVGLTLLSQSIIGLVVTFYATYVGAVFIPFLIILLEEKKLLTVKNSTFFIALVNGFLFSLFALLTSKLGFVKFSEISIYMVLMGFIGSIVAFALEKPLEKLIDILKKG